MITVIFTCYNRRRQTENCIKTITAGNPSLEVSFVVFDDGSTDGTAQMLSECRDRGLDITVLRGDGSAFWAGGMRRAIAAAKSLAQRRTSTGTAAEPQYYLLVNDDVDFYPHAVEQLIAAYEGGAANGCGSTETGESVKPAQQEKAVLHALVGATCRADGAFSYGGIRYDKGVHYRSVTPQEEDRTCDAFNMNCLLMDAETFLASPEFDPHYVHSLADFDYGLALKRMGVRTAVASFYVGVCEPNAVEGTWLDSSLSRRERLRRKGQPKGAPLAPWFYFLHKNFGLHQALRHGFTPYIRILLNK